MKKILLLVLASGLAALSATCAAAQGRFASRADVAAFASEMALRHGFDRDALLATLEAAPYQSKAIALITPATRPGQRSWQRYRARFVEPVRIRDGLAFWQAHADALDRAEASYGVPAEIVLGIIGVETIYGRNTGSFPLVGALATLAFDYPPRAELFRKELEHLLLLARESRREVGSFFGSYAGAIGFPQFLPSSVRSYAVDFDGDGQVDLEGSAADAIGSVARYLAEQGWKSGERVADPAPIADGVDVSALIDAGIEPRLDSTALAAAGITLPKGVDAATLVDLETPGQPTEYWLGYRNFYVITRYNRSSFYAMAVFQLAQALREARIGAAR